LIPGQLFEFRRPTSKGVFDTKVVFIHS